MRGTLLVIDDKNAPDQLLQLLEKHRFFCFHARGPLKVRTVLEKNQVDLIVWKENPGNRELAKDLVRAWQQISPPPVLHLFPETGRPFRLRPNPFRESAPAGIPEHTLIALVTKLVAEAKATGGRQPVQKTELAFRNIFSRLRRLGNPPGRALAAPLPGEDFHAANTALQPAERALLTPGSRAQAPSSGESPLPSGLLRRFAALFRPQNPM